MVRAGGALRMPRLSAPCCALPSASAVFAAPPKMAMAIMAVQIRLFELFTDVSLVRLGRNDFPPGIRRKNVNMDQCLQNCSNHRRCRTGNPVCPEGSRGKRCVGRESCVSVAELCGTELTPSDRHHEPASRARNRLGSTS